MNKIKMIFIVLPFSCLLTQCAKNAGNNEEIELIITEDCCFPDVEDKFIYPVTNEGEEWNKMNDDEKMNACQISEDVLKSISTLGLIRSFIDTPYSFYNHFLYSSSPTLDLCHRIYIGYNSVQELLTRKDAAKSLIAFYAATKLDCYPSIDDWFDRGDFRCRLVALEYLFTKQEILDQLGHKDKVKAVKSLLTKYKQWQNLSDMFVDGKGPSNLSVMVWVMYEDMLPYFDIESLVEFKNGYIEENIDDIIAFAESFIL